MKRQIEPKLTENENTLPDFSISSSKKKSRENPKGPWQEKKMTSSLSLSLNYYFIFKNSKFESIKSKVIILYWSIQRAHHANSVALS